MRPYPKLMSMKDSPDTVLLCNEQGLGMVVASEHPNFAVGVVLVTEHFELEDTAPEVIVWLTEGEKDSIYEAIETVDKIRASRPMVTNP